MRSPGKPQPDGTRRCTGSWRAGEPRPAFRKDTPARASAGRTVPVAVSTSLAPLVTGPVTSGRVVAAFRGAVYVAVAEPPNVLALLAPQSVRLPNAAVLAAEGAGRLPVATGVPVRVGGGLITVGERTARPVRWWEPVPRLGRVGRAELEAGVAHVARHVPTWPPPATPGAARLRRAGVRLERALNTPGADGDGRVAASEAPVRALVGLGAGLTPSGDDLLSGAMAALRLLGAGLATPSAVAASADLAAHAARWAEGTTAVSAALLRQAGRGAVAAPAARVLRAMAGREEASEAVASLLAVGHASGHDLAAGLLLGARAALAHHAATGVRRR